MKVKESVKLSTIEMRLKQNENKTAFFKNCFKTVLKLCFSSFVSLSFQLLGPVKERAKGWRQGAMEAMEGNMEIGMLSQLGWGQGGSRKSGG